MPTKRRFGIRFKVAFGYLIIAACFAVSLLLISSRLASLQKELHLITDQDIQIHDLSNQLERHMLDLDAAERGYALTGDSSHLDLYTKGLPNIQEEYSRLYGLLQINPEQQARLTEVKGSLDRWVQVAGEPVIQWKKVGNEAALSAFFKADPGKAEMDSIRTDFASFLDAENALTAARAAALDRQNSLLLTELYTLLAAVLILSALASHFISGSIVKTVRSVISAIKDMASNGAQSVRPIVVKSSDEIQDLAEATNELVFVIQQYTWKQEMVNESAILMQGINEISSLSQMYITKLAEKTGSLFGVVYLRKEQNGKVSYVRSAAFAADAEASACDSFQLGEGLAGQCALENRVFDLEHLPDTYIRVKSSLGQAAPQSLIVVPAQYDGQVEAVIELAALQPYTPMQKQLIHETRQTFGTAVHRVITRMEIVRLLGESQAQSEELQAQSEELQMQTEELQSQTEELQSQAEELRISNEQLEVQYLSVEQKSKDLETAKGELEESTRELKLSSKYKSEFLTNMSHELRTPLNSMLILSELLAGNENHTLTPEEEEYARIINSAGTELLTLINDILDLSKVEAGKLDIMAGEVNLNELPQIMERNFGPLAVQKGIEYRVSAHPEVPLVFHSDGQRLQQILKNLLSNAFKFTSAGTVSLTIRKAEERELQKLRMNGREVLAFCVEDTGIGIARDKRAMIFEAFQQADGATSRKYGGTGLGLSISREFARLLGGTIHLQSEEGKGSTFTLYLPSLEKEADAAASAILTARRETAAAAAPPPAPSEPAMAMAGAGRYTAWTSKKGDEFTPEKSVRSANPVLNGKKVLVVDDDERNLVSLRSALRIQGVHVVTAVNGRECLDVLADSPDIDLILMDIMMPELDGLEAMRLIRRNPGWLGLPIIALTAKAMKHDCEKCLEAGASDYISKPVHLDQLYSVVSVWLKRD